MIISAALHVVLGGVILKQHLLDVPRLVAHEVVRLLVDQRDEVGAVLACRLCPLLSPRRSFPPLSHKLLQWRRHLCLDES